MILISPFHHHHYQYSALSMEGTCLGHECHDLLSLCMSTQTRPQIILSKSSTFVGMELEPAREKSPLPKAQRRVESAMLHHIGQPAQYTTNWAILAHVIIDNDLNNVQNLCHSSRMTTTAASISRVPGQNGVSQAWYIVEIYHSGRKPSISTTTTPSTTTTTAAATTGTIATTSTTTITTTTITIATAVATAATTTVTTTISTTHMTTQLSIVYFWMN